MTAQVSAGHNSVTLSITLAKTGVWVEAAGLVKRIVTWPFRVFKARHHAAILNRLDERELRDIGLTRQDVIDISALPLDEDPSHHLAQIARERRQLGIRV